MVFITIAAFSAAKATGRHSKSKSKPLSRLPPGLEWADTNKDGQLSDDELERAIQMLDDKLKNAENNHSKKSTISKTTRK